MTPDERQLISGLFDRMRSFGSPQKDPEAEALIHESVQQIPDAAYMLVQSVLVQEHALQQADQRIRELESRVKELEAQAAQAPAQSGSFLSGLFGGARPAAPAQRTPASGSVPNAGARLNAAPGGRSGPIGAPQTHGPLGQQAQGQQQGGFLQSAMATAAGVAGGMLLANTISSMLGGGSSAQAAPAPTNDAASQPEQPQAQQAADDNTSDHDDAHLQDADYEPDDGGWDAGDWGGDFEI